MDHSVDSSLALQRRAGASGVALLQLVCVGYLLERSAAAPTGSIGATTANSPGPICDIDP
jgi:hypothetical protein